jgi:starvation-inducible DNA-binding protein
MNKEYILFTKIRNYHWNVVGSAFSEGHKFFQEQYEAIDEIIDEVAERVRQLNGMSSGTLSGFVEHGRLKEFSGDYPDDLKMILNLLSDHEEIIRSSKRLQRLAEDILDVTRIESNTLKLHKEQFNLKDVIVIL